MKITIIGWYGTETIGDRAILAGLFSILVKAYGKIDVKLGSLYPFFTQRTISEDKILYSKIVGDENIAISIFDSQQVKELNFAIKTSELVVLGGGPLMDMDELYMVEYAFSKAKSLRKKTAILGSGIGPLNKVKYEKIVVKIATKSDLIILRDKNSYYCLEQLFEKYHYNKPLDIYSIIDPAVECIMECKLANEYPKENIVVNLREFPLEYSISHITGSINRMLVDFVKSLALSFPEKEIQLVPMHYFHIGNDDRAFLNTIQIELNLPNIKVQNKNLNVLETLQTFESAELCFGMRFHSVIFQTLVNGNNYILDYTQPQKGKINSFLEEINQKDNYLNNNRYFNIQEDSFKFDASLYTSRNFNFDENKILSLLSIYVDKLKQL